MPSTRTLIVYQAHNSGTQFRHTIQSPSQTLTLSSSIHIVPQMRPSGNPALRSRSALKSLNSSPTNRSSVAVMNH